MGFSALSLKCYPVGFLTAMPSVKHKQPGVSSMNPGDAIQASPINMEDVHIGIEHSPTGTVYNRHALPWEGASYELINGSWRKVAGRANALSGEAMERAYPNITDRWEAFGRAQSQRPSTSGDFDSLLEDLRSAAR